MLLFTSSSTVEAIASTYRKAPVTISLFASYFVSQLVSKLWLSYRLFVALPGGPLPNNLFGWAIHYFALSPLSLHSAWTRSSLIRSFLPKVGALDQTKLSTGVALPKRQACTPSTAGTIPHRQLDQFSSITDCSATQAGQQDLLLKQAQEAVQYSLAVLLKEAESQPSHLRFGPSMIESQSTALFAISHTLVTASDNVSRSTRSAQFPCTLSRRFLSSLKGEFVHIHCTPSRAAQEAVQDGSLHMTLHPNDAALVVDQGWAELHPLAGFPSYSGFWFGWPAWLTSLRPPKTGSARWWSSTTVPTDKSVKVKKALGLPPTYVMVYSPRNQDEANVVHHIIRAAIMFAIGSRPTR
ncbi:uncharacterized protein MEPE_02183 [Melanopsichium pennsylvanicum]|uniref:Luciferase domain-containing protein n=2 Tax=Melanopsichium pennsylvanicum TaxID=63383 RepID=A0AAJ5C499_9BASI|nr:conserved hypothetical protein [Melanopsichium pennsylvanicum 4]SNX83476.1 uncharacterized protein MEPE_02183 [Melanopsichium pennsylvanicum]